MLQKRWTIKQVVDEEVNALQGQLGIHPDLCRLLVQRGVRTYDEAKKFFRSDKDHLYDPFLMKGMDKAVQRIHDAISRQEKILIYGDYDVDGTTSVAVVYSFFKSLYDKLEFYIPHRFAEGYGVSQKGMDYAVENDFKLIITLDCGIKSIAHVAYAKQHGIDVIVCDHHMPDEELPEALAILNPKQSDCHYPYKELCGCGVGYKLISAYASQHGIDSSLTDKHLDLVATAIAADIVPITDENRTLSILGLKKANENPSVPLRALRYISELNREFTISDLVFIIAPRVNAAGRMDDARKAVELFIEENELRAQEIARQLHEDNNDRRDVDLLTTTEAIDMLTGDADYRSRKSTVLYKSDWHKGVVGIVASRIIEHHYRPTIILTHSNGKVTGSARSIKGFNLFEGLNQCAEYLETYGGHYFAAGLTMSEDKLDAFKQRFEEVVERMVPSELFQPEIEIDAELQLVDVNPKFMGILKQFAPHGPENMKPVFLARNVLDYQNLSTVVKEKHLRLVIYQPGSRTMNCIGFGLADKADIVKEGKPFDILFHIEENEWQGNISLQLRILDVRKAGEV
jgi:single-stranded-DNA-specific exonuclease